MNEFLQVVEWVSNNKLLAIVIAVVPGLYWLWRVNDNRKDRARIFQYLQQSARNSGWTFRSTHAIASATNLTEDRVEVLCAQHPRIKRNEKEKQAWQLVD